MARRTRVKIQYSEEYKINEEETFYVEMAFDDYGRIETDRIRLIHLGKNADGFQHILDIYEAEVKYIEKMIDKNFSKLVKIPQPTQELYEEATVAWEKLHV